MNQEMGVKIVECQGASTSESVGCRVECDRQGGDRTHHQMRREGKTDFNNGNLLPLISEAVGTC